MNRMHSFLKLMVDKNASDLHMRVGVIPVMRVDGGLFRLNTEAVGLDEMNDVIQHMMTPEQYKNYSLNKEIDFAIGVNGLGRFRVNAYHQRGTPSLAIRFIKTTAPEFSKLLLPETILDIAMHKRGLILVTGTTGSGKSTLLASMVEHINKNTSSNIITIEDPIEFLYKDNRSIIAQREIGTDADTFSSALRGSFRQDPDIILIGEIRDSTTMETAMSAADTGHLVMSTLHTMNTVETITRIISFFPPHQHDQIRLVLSNVLVAIISLRLLPRQGGGRIPAAEILVNNANISELILKPQSSHELFEAIAEGYTQYGSQTFDQSLLQLYRDDYITLQTARQYANNPDDFDLKVSGVQSASDSSWIQ
ncbi:MAG: PilT/PilU family type 4a pilus ATPase [Fibrobacter sp.]|nr:PilT/PilU family type 4a pilus ATPase [Fibrobacter sp.]